MSGAGWETAHIDELESLPIDEEGLTWRPVRRRFGIEAFGVNAYTAAEAGRRVIEEHSEPDAHDELYFVATGGATFTLDGEELQAPAGTFVSVGPGTLRGAIASEPNTTVLAIGARRGEVFTPSPWEPTFAAFGYLRLGEVERGRAELLEVLAARPDAWEGHYNLACYEARAGEPEAAIEHLRHAVELGGDRVREVAARDSDLDSIRDALD
jgi:quercetin dioxygenase-like cupin family protein